MSESVNLPALGESVTEGTVTRWLKKVGENVEVDEPLLEISTDKVDTEIPSPISGVLEEILVEEDQTVEIGAPLAIVGEGKATDRKQPAQTDPLENPAPELIAQAKEPAPVVRVDSDSQRPVIPPPVTPSPVIPAPIMKPPPLEPPLEVTSPEPPYATPLVRKLARERNVDLGGLTGSGIGGRVRKEDILAAANRKQAPAQERPKVSQLRGTTQKLSRLRQVISSRAVDSMQKTAQLTSVLEADVTGLVAFRNRVKTDFQAKTGHKLTLLPFFIKSATEALRQYPVINSTVSDNQIHYPDYENISVAVDSERGLLTPVIRNAGDLDIARLAVEISTLAQKTRDNSLAPDELSGGTFTVTNTGSRGALFDTPVVFLPQLAIMGVGLVVKRPVVISANEGQDAIAVRSMVYVSLSYDHRIIDGADASRFLMAVKVRLEANNFEADLGL